MVPGIIDYLKVNGVIILLFYFMPLVYCFLSCRNECRYLTFFVFVYQRQTDFELEIFLETSFKVYLLRDS